MPNVSVGVGIRHLKMWCFIFPEEEILNFKVYIFLKFFKKATYVRQCYDIMTQFNG